MALNPALTVRQYKVLQYIDSYCRRKGSAPTIQEIAAHFKFSKPTALLHLRALERKGAIRRSKYAARNIDVLVPSLEIKRARYTCSKKGKREFVNLIPMGKDREFFANPGRKGRDNIVKSPPASRHSEHFAKPPKKERRQFVGLFPPIRKVEITTEPPQLALPLLGSIAAGRPIEAVETKEVVNLAEMFPNDNCFMLRVRGDSMIEEQIRDGDYVIVEKRQTAKNGDLVVALLDNNEATLKRFYIEKGRARLQPANPSQPPLFAKNFSIQGVVIGVLRKY